MGDEQSKAALGNWGELKFDRGCLYKGQLVDGQPHGIGEFECPDGTSYKGQWKFGKFSGGGKSCWATGHYSGTFKGGLFSGKGKMVSKGEKE